MVCYFLLFFFVSRSFIKTLPRPRKYRFQTRQILGIPKKEEVSSSYDVINRRHYGIFYLFRPFITLDGGERVQFDHKYSIDRSLSMWTNDRVHSGYIFNFRIAWGAVISLTLESTSHSVGIRSGLPYY